MPAHCSTSHQIIIFGTDEEIRDFDFSAYNAELVNRYRTGQYLTEADKREARKLLEVAR